MLKNAKVLITGGAGFIGSHLADRLLSLKNNVIVYDNLDEYYSSKEENVRHNVRKQNFKFVTEDITKYEALSKCMKGVDTVFHLAAQPGVGFSMDNPEKTLTVNIFGTLYVLKAAKEAGVKRVVLASSSSVYGSPRYTPVDEEHPTEPLSVYGASKLVAEKLGKVYNDQQGLEVIILRYHTVYGPRQRPDMAIHRWTKQILEGKPVTVYGDGSQTRDFTYVDDVIAGTIRASEVEGIGGEVFNIGGGGNVSVRNTIDLLAEAIGADANVTYEPPRAGDVSATHANINKARALLDFKPKVALDAGLARFVEWYTQLSKGER